LTLRKIWIRAAAPVLVLALLGAALTGCPPFDVRQALIVNPKTLDFGANVTVLQFEVRAVYSSRPISPLNATPGDPWIAVTPPSAVSNGPDEIAIFTVTINRSRLPTPDPVTGETPSGTVLVGSPEVVPVEVEILATR